MTSKLMLTGESRNHQDVGGLHGASFAWPADEKVTLERLARVARDHAAVFANRWGEVGFNVLLLDQNRRVMPGEFDPARIVTKPGRDNAQTLLVGILKANRAISYAIFCDVRLPHDPVAKVMVSAYQKGQSISWLFPVLELAGTAEPVPEICTAAVSGWWSDLLSD